MTVFYVDWGGKVKLTWLPTTELPERKLITSVHAFCFDHANLSCSTCKFDNYVLIGTVSALQLSRV